jgi:hypothetical protein
MNIDNSASKTYPEQMAVKQLWSKKHILLD